MQGRRIAAHWPLAVFVIALAGIALLFVSRGGSSGSTAPRLVGQQAPRYESQALAAVTEPTAATEPTAVATPTLLETLHAVDALVRAGAMPAPTSTPTLKETLQAADALVKSGAIAPPPSLEQVLVAADKLRIAGVLPSPQPPPTLEEILRAADAIRIASQPKQQGAPPQAPLVEPTSTPVPPAPPTAVPPTIAPPTVAPPTSTPVPPPPAPSSTPATGKTQGGTGFWDADFTAQVFAIVNQRRASAGLGPVTVESRLTQSARDYAKVLADNNWFSHTGPDGSTLVTRVTATGFPFDVQIGEVLAWGTDHWQPSEIVQAWMDSPGHKEQLLGPYTRAGAGCYFTDNGSTVRCVMDFAG